MDWHKRFAEQAAWTSDLRAYLFGKARVSAAHRVLEVGCGTGAVLEDLDPTLPPAPAGPILHGLDISLAALVRCRTRAPSAVLSCGDAQTLPFGAEVFDLVFCHFVLLWLPDALAALHEMKRVTRQSGHVIAFAEPDYGQRLDQPPKLALLGKLQQESLEEQGANTTIGSHMADLFMSAGLHVLECGEIRMEPRGFAACNDFGNEWAVLREDLRGRFPPEELDRLAALDLAARRDGKRVLHVPTYFVFAQV